MAASLMALPAQAVTGGFLDRGALLLARGVIDLARCVGVDGRDGEPDHQVRPARERRGGDEAGRDDRDIGECVVARRQKCRAGETAGMAAITRQDDARR